MSGWVGFLIGLTLHGTLTHTEGYKGAVTQEGRIGVLISHYGSVGWVHPGSPAEEVGIREGDKVTEVDGLRDNVDGITGTPGSVVCLRVIRHGVLYTFLVRRVKVEEIHD